LPKSAVVVPEEEGKRGGVRKINPTQQTAERRWKSCKGSGPKHTEKGLSLGTKWSVHPLMLFAW